jgi:hypothetical protein
LQVKGLKHRRKKLEEEVIITKNKKEDGSYKKTSGRGTGRQRTKESTFRTSLSPLLFRTVSHPKRCIPHDVGTMGNVYIWTI